MFLVPDANHFTIHTVPGRNACEIRMMHQEDAGLNPDMAKLAFAKGIWRYISKMNDALRQYSAINNLQMSSAVNANGSVHKVRDISSISGFFIVGLWSLCQHID